MNFQNSLYTIVPPVTDSSAAPGQPCACGCSEQGGAVCGAGFTILLNPEHVIYRAHFPEDPITPGVCIIQIGVELLGRALGWSLELCRVKNVKFLSILRPDGVPVTVSIRKIMTGDLGSAREDSPVEASGDIPGSVSGGVSSASSGVVSAQIEFSRMGGPVAKMSLICRKRPVARESAEEIPTAWKTEPASSGTGHIL